MCFFSSPKMPDQTPKLKMTPVPPKTADTLETVGATERVGKKTRRRRKGKKALTIPAPVGMGGGSGSGGSYS